MTRYFSFKKLMGGIILILEVTLHINGKTGEVRFVFFMPAYLQAAATIFASSGTSFAQPDEEQQQRQQHLLLTDRKHLNQQIPIAKATGIVSFIQS